MDFITGLPEAQLQGELVDAILVVVDRYTKMSRFFAVKTTITSPQLAELLHREIELRYGAPRGIVSDRGSLFTSEFWSNLCFYSRIKQRLSTAFHPQTDGQTERANQVLEVYLRSFTSDEIAAWPRLLSEAEFAINNSISATTGISPFMALYGYNPEIRAGVVDEPLGREVLATHERVEHLYTVREKLRDR